MTIVLIAVALYLLATGLLIRTVALDEVGSHSIWLWPASAAVTSAKLPMARMRPFTTAIASAVGCDGFSVTISRAR